MPAFDAHALGNPAIAGRFYGVNIAGGILGPLVTAYILLPAIGTRATLIVLSVPMFLLFAWTAWRASSSLSRRLAFGLLFGALTAFSVTVSRGYEDGVLYEGPQEVRRDYVATVTAYGESMDKHLLVNGIGMTTLTPITKVMAHLPLAMKGDARSGLVICFGMGTTFRAMHSWGIDVTAVELSRSVTESFGFFFPDFAAVIGDPKARIVVDDGRRYLLRSNRKFDVIAIDPRPPIEAASSSLLYSNEFYDVVKAHLAPNGILQQWFPGSSEAKSEYAVARSLRASFPYVVAFRSIADWGHHFLASLSPIPDITPAEFVKRLSENAKRDLMEWNSEISIEKMAENILAGRTQIETLLPPRTQKLMVTDDLPYNEYFLLRRTGLIN